MAYIATKPCKFAGQSFRIGEVIPAELIQPGSARNLVTMGKIAEHDAESVVASEPTIENENIQIVIHAEEGNMPLDVTKEGLQSVFDALTSNVSEAETVINKMTDQDALILLHISDKRKSVQEAAETRAQYLSQEGEESEGEQ